MSESYFNLTYLHKFASDAEFSGFCYTDRYYEPFVSTTYLGEEVDDRVDYNLRKRQKLLKEPLTFEILSDGVINWKTSNNGYTKSIQYSLDNGETWETITSNTNPTPISVTTGNIVKFIGDNGNYAESSTTYTYFDTTCQFNVYGNIMSLIDSDDYIFKKTLSDDYTFDGLFRGCSGLINAENLILPATTLSQSCYENMFYECTNLVTAPELPAKILRSACYYQMFYNCESLAKCPELPATVLAKDCYYFMFRFCHSLKNIPKLPATDLAEGCYRYMFNRCCGLESVHLNLNTTIIPDDACRGMFAYCSGITEASGTILAEEIGERGCYSMFIGCSAMTKTIDSVGSNGCAIGISGCSTMFQGCSSLTKAPELPATQIGACGYLSMFYECESLTSVQSTLPAMTLGKSCYRSMFSSCTNLVNVPMLPATTLVDECYMWMFNHTQIHELICLATAITATDAVRSPLTDVPANGTLYINPMSDETSYNNLLNAWRTSTHIPEGGTEPVHDIPASWSIEKYQS